MVLIRCALFPMCMCSMKREHYQESLKFLDTIAANLKKKLGAK